MFPWVHTAELHAWKSMSHRSLAQGKIIFHKRKENGVIKLWLHAVSTFRFTGFFPMWPSLYTYLHQLTQNVDYFSLTIYIIKAIKEQIKVVGVKLAKTSFLHHNNYLDVVLSILIQLFVVNHSAYMLCLFIWNIQVFFPIAA